MNEDDKILIFVDLRYTTNVLVSVTLFRNHLKLNKELKTTVIRLFFEAAGRAAELALSYL